MTVKRGCALHFALYVIAALFVGHMVYRRMPMTGAAVWGGLIGGGFVWLGLASLAGVWTKIAEGWRQRRTMEGGPLPDDAKVAVAGSVEAMAAALASPFDGRPCVAYRYEVRAAGAVLYDGFALAPSAILSEHGQIRLLAIPDLKLAPREVPRSEAQPNFSDYIARTEFREARVENAMTGQGSVRNDTRRTHGDVPLDHATFVEWSLAPGDRVYAAGQYSAQRSAIVQELILTDEAPSFVAPSVRGAIGSLIGAAIFLGIAAAGLAGFYAFVPLAASEQLSPDQRHTWREVRFERVLDRRVRGTMRKAGLLDSGTPTIMLEPGTARGRVTTAGHDVAVSRASATRLGDMTVIRIDDDVLALTLDRDHHPLRLRFGNDDVDARTFARDLDVEITDNSERHGVAGRITYFRDDAETPACRVTFHADLR